MIAVRVRDDRAMDRPPRIDVKSARFAVQPAVRGADQLTKLRHDGDAERFDGKWFRGSLSAMGWTDGYDLPAKHLRPVRTGRITVAH
jgi:hypothetical protein